MFQSSDSHLLPNKIISGQGDQLKPATGKNPNKFYYIFDSVTKPIISQEATLKPLVIKPTYVYDIPTEKGKSYTFRTN